MIKGKDIAYKTQELYSLKKRKTVKIYNLIVMLLKNNKLLGREKTNFPFLINIHIILIHAYFEQYVFNM